MKFVGFKEWRKRLLLEHLLLNLNLNLNLPNQFIPFHLIYPLLLNLLSRFLKFLHLLLLKLEIRNFIKPASTKLKVLFVIR